MRSVNKVILIGNATRAAELRQTGSGKAVSNIRLATNRTVNGTEHSQFHTVVCWERLAETTGEYVKKGDPLYVEGRLEYRTFQDEEGKERGVCEIIASDVGFLGRRRAGEQTEEASVASQASGTSAPDDIPF
jgi:single-strand DNA-binding protein